MIGPPVAMRVSHDERAASIRGSGTVLIFATLHGLATMANNRMIDPLDDQLISEQWTRC
jgi:hypothetical protein